MARFTVRTFVKTASLKLMETRDWNSRVPDLHFGKVPRTLKSSTLTDMTTPPHVFSARFPVLALAILLSTACASYSAHRHASRLALARQDDAACLAQGWRYPEPRYVSCRMDLQDARLHKDWMNLQLMQQTRNQPAGIPQPYPYKEAYRPLDRDHFSCRLSREANQDYVLCDEDDDGPGTRN